MCVCVCVCVKHATSWILTVICSACRLRPDDYISQSPLCTGLSLLSFFLPPMSLASEGQCDAHVLKRGMFSFKWLFLMDFLQALCSAFKQTGLISSRSLAKSEQKTFQLNEYLSTTHLVCFQGVLSNFLPECNSSSCRLSGRMLMVIHGKLFDSKASFPLPPLSGRSCALAANPIPIISPPLNYRQYFWTPVGLHRENHLQHRLTTRQCCWPKE